MTMVGTLFSELLSKLSQVTAYIVVHVLIVDPLHARLYKVYSYENYCNYCQGLQESFICCIVKVY